MWALILDIQGEDLDLFLFDTEEEALQCLGDTVWDRYGEIFNDDPPPREYSEQSINEWMAHQLICDRWLIKEMADV